MAVLAVLAVGSGGMADRLDLASSDRLFGHSDEVVGTDGLRACQSVSSPLCWSVNLLAVGGLFAGCTQSTPGLTAGCCRTDGRCVQPCWYLRRAVFCGIAASTSGFRFSDSSTRDHLLPRPPHGLDVSSTHSDFRSCTRYSFALSLLTVVSCSSVGDICWQVRFACAGQSQDQPEPLAHVASWFRFVPHQSSRVADIYNWSTRLEA